MSYHRFSLKPWHTFGINVYAKNIVIVTSISALFYECQPKDCQKDEPILLLGQGSNVLFLQNFNGKVLINRIKGIRIVEKTNSWLLHVGAGENWHQLVKTTLDRGLGGLENLALIPGCVGSAPIQNIGAYDLELDQVCEYVDIIFLSNGEYRRLNTIECCFGYRDSIFKHLYKDQYAVIAVGLKLNKQWRPILTYGHLRYLNSKTVTPIKIFNAVCRIRRSKLPDPCTIGNAGSFFKNPLVTSSVASDLFSRYPKISQYLQKNGKVKLSAAQLIDHCLLKGHHIGGAAVYGKQAIVLINTGSASSEDIINLARIVRQRVAEKFNVWLEPEVCFISATGITDSVKAII
ncbi:UDP-N-acetylenolpyruvoylglucosamine reductase [Candidatus Erwinia haradaeae]|uniref:UDP-N-acetylenolpyruvoylglucosamine reductase n=1 Tax=Candidatus Erwinia haradaeae TaxID=1922217 RepID=A0A451CZ31_9GAMM|nr:UDP-N-acetylmuramate dehydrogenase [Candidatus Erwinia haradaeae]VFP78686.1 UDP-N-acetylenolpyruvoylglucosamine reductase [Candidatus Erwinia haradaeae]